MRGHVLPSVHPSTARVFFLLSNERTTYFVYTSLFSLLLQHSALAQAPVVALALPPEVVQEVALRAQIRHRIPLEAKTRRTTGKISTPTDIKKNSTLLKVDLSAFSSLSLSLFLSFSLSLSLSVCLSVCLSVSVSLFVRPFIILCYVSLLYRSWPGDPSLRTLAWVMRALAWFP